MLLLQTHLLMICLIALVCFSFHIYFVSLSPVSSNGHFLTDPQCQTINCDPSNSLTLSIKNETQSYNKTLYEDCCLKSRLNLLSPPTHGLGTLDEFDCELNKCNSYKSRLCLIASLNTSFVQSMVSSADTCQCCIFHNISQVLLDEAFSQAAQVFKLKTSKAELRRSILFTAVQF